MAVRSPLLQILRTPPEPSPVAAEQLRAYAEGRAAAGSEGLERCDLCGAGMEADHGHVANIAAQTLLCVCRACYWLFAHDGAGGSRFRAVPARYQRLPGFARAEAAWDRLGIPIGVAFLLRCSGREGAAARYPSPAGAIEAEVPSEAWADLAAIVPELATLVPDVEAVIVRDRRSPPPGAPTRRFAELEGLIVPLDCCYELVGRIRRVWSGLQGGEAVWREIDDHFSRASARAEQAPAP